MDGNTISADVSAFRGAGKVHIDLKKVTLLAGPNAVGKSSVLQAIAATMTGNPALFGIKKTDARQLVQDGAAESVCTIYSERGSRTITWPACTVSTQMEPPTASAIAVGLESLVDLTSLKDRSSLIGRYLSSKASYQDLKAALPELTETKLQAVIADIKTNGWDLACDKHRERATQGKGRWHEATGEAYGTKKAQNWFPAVWDPAIEGKTDGELQAEIEAAKKALEGSIGSMSIQQEELKMLQEEAARVVDLDVLEKAKHDARLEHEDAKRRRARLPSTPDNPYKIQPCPHCGKSVELVGLWQTNEFALQVPETTSEKLSKAQFRQRGLDIASADGTLARTKGEIVKADQAFLEGQKSAERIAKAKQVLAEMQENPGNAGKARDIEEKRRILALAETRLTMYRQKKTADQHAEIISKEQSIVDILAPTGLRAAKIQQGIALFNNALGQNCVLVGWGKVQLTSEFLASYEGRLYRLCSVSEQFRVRVILQVTMASHDGSELVIIDGTDVLDRAGRNGLINLCRKQNFKTLLGMTITDYKQIPPPDLESKGIGATYWIENGVATRYPITTSMEEFAEQYPTASSMEA
ncbi:MAG: DUF2813 domain-containing protein [Magnetococcus sp. DMHC-1]